MMVWRMWFNLLEPNQFKKIYTLSYNTNWVDIFIETFSNLNKAIKSILLVFTQFSCIGFLLFGSRSNNISIAVTIIIGLSIVIAFWAIFTMQKSKLKIFPAPSADAILITNGPYQYIRHPMYTSVLLCCFGFLMIYFNLARTLIFLILLIDLLIKLHWEEAMLKSKFKGYQKYCENTNKLLPFIY